MDPERLLWVPGRKTISIPILGKKQLKQITFSVQYSDGTFEMISVAEPPFLPTVKVHVPWAHRRAVIGLQAIRPAGKAGCARIDVQLYDGRCVEGMAIPRVFRLES